MRYKTVFASHERPSRFGVNAIVVEAGQKKRSADCAPHQAYEVSASVATATKAAAVEAPAREASPMKSTTTMEPTTAEASAASHHGPGVKCPARRSCTGVYTVRVGATGRIVRSWSPSTNIGGVKRMVEMAAVERSNT